MVQCVLDLKGIGIIFMLVLAIGYSGPIIQPIIDRDPINTSNPRNIILMIGDGMGYNYTRLAQLVEYGITRNMTMMQLQSRLSSETFSANSEITDSAAAGTAIATGEKTNNGMISMSPNGTVLLTIQEIAHNLGKATGLVATSYIQHATPAAFMTHVTDRGSTSEISRQIVEESNVDVLLGGGFSYFSEIQIETMELRGYSVLRNRSSLIAANATPILGLFANSHIDYEQNRNLETIPSLVEMTNISIELLSRNEKGFFLMVEGSRIDHAGHANDKVNAALETIAFDATVDLALDYVENQKNTLLIVTADHETGGLAVIDSTISEELPQEFSDEEERRELRIERANNVTVSWSTNYHTATNVPLLANGPEFGVFENDTTIDNTNIFDEMKSFYEQEVDANSESTTTGNSGSTSTSTTETVSEEEPTETSENNGIDANTTLEPNLLPLNLIWALAILIPISMIITVLLLKKKYGQF